MISLVKLINQKNPIKMQAIILAGGFGTRLKSIICDTPKPMAKIDEKPFLFYLVSKLHQYKFKKIIFSVHHLKEKVMEYFGTNFFGIEIEYAIENEPLGTGGAIMNSLNYISFDEPVFILNGDSFFNIDLTIMMDFHLNKKADFTISLKSMQNPTRYGLVEINENGFVKNFIEKSNNYDFGYINSGIYIINPKIFAKFILPTKFSFENDFMCKYFNKILINTFKSDDYFIDIGVPEDYIKAQNNIARLTKNKALFLDRDGVINHDYGYVGKIENFKFTDEIFNLCKKAQNEGYILIVITNQSGIAKAKYNEEDFFELTKWMENQFLKQKIKITKTYYCPFHKDAIIEKYRIDSFDRKPNPGMILKALADFNIDPDLSIFIGDNDCDEKASLNAKIGRFYYYNDNIVNQINFNYLNK